MASYKTTALVIGRVNYREADRILTFLSQDHGKISALAKSVRKAGSKLAAHLEWFTKIELMLATSRNLDIVTSARVLAQYQQILADYDAMRVAFLACEMLNKLTGHQTGPELFALLDDHLQALNLGANPAVVEISFKLKLLDQLGYRPNLEECVRSRAEITAGRLYHFSSEGGGLVAATHAKPEDPAVSESHIKLWRLALQLPITKLAAIKGAAAAAAESLPIANDFYDYLFGKRFKSSEI